MPAYYRSDQARITVYIRDVLTDSISWDTMEGGDNTAETVNYLPGGMAPAIELGGIPKRGDLTVTRIWSDALITVYKRLDLGVGVLAGSVTYTVMKNQHTPVTGQGQTTYTGVLKSVTRPNYDSTSSTEAKLQLVFGLNESIT